eukprot:11211721-Lingulodinium_polyedra.AAC.1
MPHQQFWIFSLPNGVGEAAAATLEIAGLARARKPTRTRCCRFRPFRQTCGSAGRSATSGGRLMPRR